MSNTYEFTKLSEVEALAEVPENANALVEVDGAIKRVSGSGLGGGASFVVNITSYIGSNNNAASMDKTYTEIVEQIKSGNQIIAKAIVNDIQQLSTTTYSMYDDGEYGYQIVFTFISVYGRSTTLMTFTVTPEGLTDADLISLKE